MFLWQELMREGKNAFHKSAYALAIDCNLKARSLAETIFTKNFADDPERALAMVLVSSFSLMDSYEAMGDFQESKSQLDNAVDFLLRVHNQTQSNNNPINEAQQLALIQAAHKLKQEWGRFIQHWQHEYPRLNTETFNLPPAKLSKLLNHNNAFH